MIPATDAEGVRLFLCGDLMTGRGIDQIMGHPGDPRLHEPFVKSATRYVSLAEATSGAIPRGAGPAHIWGDALVELDRARPAARIVNLETAITTSDEFWRGKGIHYRMHPANAECLSVARIDCCTLANNHVLDWGHAGLRETIATLHAAGIRTAGAGDSAAQAHAPAVIGLSGGGRVLVFAYGSPSSGIPDDWVATGRRGGISLLDESRPEAVEQVVHKVRELKRPGDLVVVSIHWGTNWGYQVPPEQRRLAQQLVDEAGVDVVCGHSSHHPRPLEVHRGKLILYGCGDFLNDYEGIGGYEAYRPELGFMYLPTLEASSGQLLRLVLVPTRIRKFQVNRASPDDTAWLRQMLQSQEYVIGARVRIDPEGNLELVSA